MKLLAKDKFMKIKPQMDTVLESSERRKPTLRHCADAHR